MAALIPDFDSIIGLFFPFENGVFSHTIIGGLLFTLIYTSLMWVIGFRFLKAIDINYQQLFLMAVIGMLSHLFLDSFTFYYSDASSATSHMYFWPLWDFPFHINTTFPGATWEIRVLVEVFFSVFLGITILIYGWIIKKENPFEMCSPKKWSSYIEVKGSVKDVSFLTHSLLFFNSLLIILLLINYFV